MSIVLEDEGNAWEFAIFGELDGLKTLKEAGVSLDDPKSPSEYLPIGVPPSLSECTPPHALPGPTCRFRLLFLFRFSPC